MVNLHRANRISSSFIRLNIRILTAHLLCSINRQIIHLGINSKTGMLTNAGMNTLSGVDFLAPPEPALERCG